MKFSCSDISDKESVSYTLRESLLTVIKVYINLVHDYKNIGRGYGFSKSDYHLFIMRS